MLYSMVIDLIGAKYSPCEELIYVRLMCQTLPSTIDNKTIVLNTEGAQINMVQCYTYMRALMSLFMPENGKSEKYEHLLGLSEGEYLMRFLMHNLSCIVKHGKKSQEPYYPTQLALADYITSHTLDLASALLEFTGVRNLLTKHDSLSPFNSSRVSSPRKEMTMLSSRKNSQISGRKSFS